MKKCQGKGKKKKEEEKNPKKHKIVLFRNLSCMHRTHRTKVHSYTLTSTPELQSTVMFCDCYSVKSMVGNHLEKNPDQVQLNISFFHINFFIIHLNEVS